MIETLLYYAGIVSVAAIVLVTYLAVTVGILVLVLTIVEYLLLTVEALAGTVVALSYLIVMLNLSPPAYNHQRSAWVRVRHNFSNRVAREHRLSSPSRLRISPYIPVRRYRGRMDHYSQY